MFSDQYRHDIFRKCTIAFGNLFNDMVLERHDLSGNRVESIPIPLAYGPKEKIIARLDSDPNLDKPVAIQLPRMSFEITSVVYDGTRKLNSIQQNINTTSGTDYNKLLRQYVPVPYNINYSLSIMTKNANDAVQIVEQILPYFSPDYTLAMNLIPSMNLTIDVPLVLMNVNPQDSYEGDYNIRRALIWQLDFTMKTYIFGPIKKTGIIKSVQVDSTIVETANVAAGITSEDYANKGRSSRVTTTPGLTSAGLPTEDPTQSIPINQIKASDDYGFAQDIDQFYDGLKYNPKTDTDMPAPFPE